MTKFTQYTIETAPTSAKPLLEQARKAWGFLLKLRKSPGPHAQGVVHGRPVPGLGCAAQSLRTSVRTKDMNMRTYTLLALITLISNSALGAPYQLDVSHTEVGFSVRHLMVSSTKGVFRTFRGALDFDEAKGVAQNIDVEIQVVSIDTRDAKRDEHLKSPDFFDAAKYPVITFKADSASIKENRPVKVRGLLTIRGISKPITMEVTYAGTQVDPFGVAHSGFGLSTKINRKDFGVSWNKALDQGGVAVGEQVDIEISGEIVPKTGQK